MSERAYKLTGWAEMPTFNLWFVNQKKIKELIKALQ